MADPQLMDANGDELAAAVVREALTVVANAGALHAELFAAYPEADVKTVSRLEREAKELPNRSLAYGEIPFATVEETFQLMRSQFGVLLDRGGKFYDLGSGCGKVVMAAALLHDFSQCCGIEILEGLHGIALKVLDHWRYKMLDSLPAAKVDIDVGFTRADAATNVDIWKDATLVFCNSTCFSGSLIQSISTAADQLNDGTYFVTITKPLSSKRWKTMLEQKLPMSWGKATVIVQKKVF
uniref:Histone-lysine N-methyltransferase, H3 lysine-79 specific n=1 Tax=Globisporangium ultimum (strain ATCC 200006 / CBS 805.95 / DAOM BR144) TaxID=431595 RepID=K3W8C8_GLOUD